MMKAYFWGSGIILFVFAVVLGIETKPDSTNVLIGALLIFGIGSILHEMEKVRKKK